MILTQPLLLDKPVGWTPLDALEALRAQQPELTDVKLAYAGRLDPMASGLLPVLRGGQLAHQEEYWGLPKEYDATVILGLMTDSYDLLGLASPGGAVPEEKRILAGAAGLVGKHLLSVPVFSSPSVNGKPLFAWAREGLPTDLPVPVRRMRVIEVRVRDVAPMTLDGVAGLAAQGVARVSGSFRQDAILQRWSEVAAHDGCRPLAAVQLTVACGGGTYVRSLAHELGRRLRCGGMLAALRRIRVGPWTADDEGIIRFG